MMRKKAITDNSTQSIVLRERAEEVLRAKAADLPVMPTNDVQALIHELNVHQIELELQNEELRQAQVELSQSRDRYSDLYEYAPVGYLTLSREGQILEANLQAATMLGVERQALVQAQLTKFLTRNSQDNFYRHRQSLISDEGKQICELDMLKADGTPLVMRLESIPFDHSMDRKFRTALIDITDRKQAERRLEVQERFNRSILDALSAHVAVIDATGQIVATNRAWQNFAAANDTSWQSGNEGKNYLAICDRAASSGDADAIETARAIRQLIAGYRETWEYEYPSHATDEQRWIYCRVTRFSAEGAEHVVIAHENITALKQAQQQLAAARARFETLELVSPVAIMFFDANGKCIEVNTRWCDMSGIGRQAAYGDNWYSAVHPADRSHLSQAWTAAVRQGEPAHLEYRLLRPDGSMLWLVSQSVPIRDANGGVSGFIQVSVDMTEQKRTEFELKSSEERLRSVLKTAADAIITIDESGIVQSFNQAAERMFGYTASEAIGQNVRVLMPSPYHEEHDGYLKRFQDTGIQRIIGIGREVTGRRKDGTTFPLDLSVSAVDHLNLYVGLLRDISDRKTLERQVVEIASLEQQRIGQDLHDSVGQQLTGMILLAQLLVESARKAIPREESANPSESSLRLKALSSQAERLGVGLQETLQDIRTICRELTPVPISQDGLVVALERLVANVSSNSLLPCTFHCSVPTGDLDNVTATHLFNITQGAISNTLRHAQATSIQVRLEQSENQLVLSIRDDGIGLLPSSIAGLGIRIMQNRAHIIGGILAIRNVKPYGTEVTCTIPSQRYRPESVSTTETLFDCGTATKSE